MKIKRGAMAESASLLLAAGIGCSAEPAHERVAVVTHTPGLVAFWDFVKREPDGERRFLAHVPPGSKPDYPLEAGNYVRDYWGEGNQASYADFPLLGRGPFGNAIRIRKEEDATFRPFLYVSRARLHDTPLDIKGPGRSVTVVVWAIRESGNHALAGIWHEGTDLKQASTVKIRRVERGQRQYALFAGLNLEGSACGHLSENGASFFRNRYALHKCNSAEVSPAVPADSPVEVLDASWQCFAMTFDHARHELTGWLNGVAGDRWLNHPKTDKLISSAYNAYMQGHFARLPGVQEGEDETFPQDQYYNPPETEPINVEVLREEAGERVERREYRYTRIEVTLRDGQEVSRDLVTLRLNPWWFPHALYTPPNDGSGGPFTIGRVIHSSRTVGFTGWIGGVAVFDRALSAAELQLLSALRSRPPISAATPIPRASAANAPVQLITVGWDMPTPARLRKQYRLGFTQYLDAVTHAPDAMWYPPPVRGSQAARVEANALYNQSAGDNYVFFHGERARWWAGGNPKYPPWPERIPGVDRALRRVADPVGVAREALTRAAAADNRLRNGGLTFTNAQGLPRDWFAW